MSTKTVRKSQKPKADAERQLLLEGIRERIRLSPGLWFETHGAIEPKLGSILKAPELRVTALQKRKNDIVKFCILNDIPCRILTLKCRQDGSSTFAVAIGYRWLSNMRASGCIIGGSHDQGANLFRKLRIFAEHDDFDPQNKCHVLDRKARWPNGSLMEQFTAGNPEVGRSGTYQVAICTEVARWAEEGVANAADILAGLLKCVPNERLTFVELESTARGQSGDFYERWQNAITFEELKAGKRGFVKVFASWFEAPERRLNPAFEQDREQCVPPQKVEELRKRYGLDDSQIAWMQWAVREECAKDFDKFCEDYPFDPESAFRTSGRCRFNATNLQKMVERARMFPPDFGNIDLLNDRAVWRPCASDEARVLRWEQPKDNCRYLLSVDSMTGETQVGGKDPDNHAVGVLRAGFFDPNRGCWTAPKLVARLIDDWGLWERNRKYALRWDIDVLEEQIWRLAQYYGNCLIVPEANMDRGLIELLKLRSANIYLRQVFNRREQTEQKAYGWQTTPSTREMIIENLARAIREQDKDSEGIDILCPITLSELESFVTKANGRSEAMPGRHDDCVLQTAIGLACIEGATAFVQPVTVTALPPDLARLEREEEANARSGMAMRW